MKYNVYKKGYKPYDINFADRLSIRGPTMEPYIGAKMSAEKVIHAVSSSHGCC
jgi:hypothetical protein